MCRLVIKDDLDDYAFTSDAMMQQIDMPTRECPHGLQFLFCRNNTSSGGEGIYADAYGVTTDLAKEELTQFQAPCEIDWTYNNRLKTNSYKATGAVIERAARGRKTGVRYNTWLTAPLVASLDDQEIVPIPACAPLVRLQEIRCIT